MLELRDQSQVCNTDLVGCFSARFPLWQEVSDDVLQRSISSTLQGVGLITLTWQSENSPLMGLRRL